MFDKIPKDGEPSRSEFLRKAFGVDFGFSSKRGIAYQYVSLVHTLDEAIMVGRVGGQKEHIESKPPESDFQPIKTPSWQAVHILIDPEHHDDGQKIAIEIRPEVGSARAIAEGLGLYLSNQPSSVYDVEVREIIDPATFWDFVRENHGEIVWVEFEFVTPNMFGVRDQIDKEMKELQENEKARTARLSLTNKHGLNLDTDRVRSSVDYVTEGGGGLRAKTSKNKRYSSRNKQRRIVVENENIEFIGEKRDLQSTTGDGLISRLIKVLFQ